MLGTNYVTKRLMTNLPMLLGKPTKNKREVFKTLGDTVYVGQFRTPRSKYRNFSLSIFGILIIIMTT